MSTAAALHSTGGARQASEEAWLADAVDDRLQPDGLAAVDRKLAALCCERGPLRAVLARIAYRLVVVRAWERIGHARLSDYAVERLGLSAGLLAPLVSCDPLGRFMEEWVAWAGQVTVRRLRDDVEWALALEDTDRAAFRQTGGLPPVRSTTCAAYTPSGCAVLAARPTGSPGRWGSGPASRR